MAATKTALCQLALARLGSTTNISDVDADTSQEAKLCRIFYDNALRNVFEECDWPFATTTVQIALVETNLTTGWLSHYTYPSDAVRILGVEPTTATVSFQPNKNYASEFELVYGPSAKYIASYHNVSLYCTYIKLVTNVQLYPASFNEAFCFRLASDLALGLNKSFQLSNAMSTAYLDRIKQAKANQKNENNVKCVAQVVQDRNL